MATITISSGLTLKVPTRGSKNWADTMLSQCFEKISAHDHTGSGKGLAIGTNAISSDAITTVKILDAAVTTAKINDTAVTSGKLADDAVTTAKILDGAVTEDKLAASITPPAGVILMYGGSSAPTGYLLCDGSAVSRSTYSDLFDVIGETYGAGDGSTTFNVPDHRQRFPIGKASSGTGSTLGGTGGNIDHTHSVPAHYHSATATGADLSISVNGYINSSAFGSNSFFGRINSAAGSQSNLTFSPASGISGRVGLVTGGVNGDSAMTSGTGNPPFITHNFIIKT